MDAISDLIISNEGLIYKIINKYKNYFELDDLYQVAVMGLIKAYKHYHKEYNTKFTSYAYPYILGEVVKYVNDYRNIKVNKNIRRLYTKILRAKETLAQKLMREPTTDDLAAFLEIDAHVIDEVIVSNSMVDSLDKVVLEDDMNFELYNKYGYCDNSVENYPLISEIEKLPLIDRQIIIGRYYDDMSQKEVGKELGMYQVEVSRRERKILKKLRDNIG